MAKQKHILIDARLYGTKHTGIGRYTQNLLKAIFANPDSNNYRFSLLVYKDLLKTVKKDVPNNVTLIPTDIPHYSFKEQFLLPFLLHRQQADLVHFTHFNKPIFYFPKSVVTIHDLIKHFFKGKETTTKSPLFYWPKYWSYLLVSTAVIKSSHIIVPSNFWKKYITKNFKIDTRKVATTYEAVEPNFLNQTNKSSKPEKYLLYTGNLYPHKNVPTLIQALCQLPDMKLKIICARSLFSQRLELLIKKYKLERQVEFLGFVDDKDFIELYSKATALVHPAFMEGFSLTGLEAMALSCPVIAANASCLPEIYGNAALYFNPTDPKDLAVQIKKLIANPKLRSKLIDAGQLQVKKYSWTKTAAETLDVYRKILTND